MSLDLDQFQAQFARFKEVIAYNDKGRPFVNFNEGVAAVWEDYKPRLRAHALDLLGTDQWTEDEIGSGAILERVIGAIEIDDRSVNLTNNLVFWQNRFGHSNRAHRAFLEARADKGLRTGIERGLYGLFSGEADEGATFDRLAELVDAKYPLLAYLYFLKDIDRFMPILPSTFDRAFRDLNIDLVTQRNCSWDNYSRYVEALGQIHDALRDVASLNDARLVDAHSFCWMLQRMEQPEIGADGVAKRRGPDAGRKLGSREKSIWEMKDSVLQTVKQARGQTEERRIKLKELRMSERELEELIGQLMDQQEDRCALTGLLFQFRGTHDDLNMLPSLDRVDSGGHYEKGNLQVVCRFVNFWKQDADNEEFKRLLMLVRGLEE